METNYIVVGAAIALVALGCWYWCKSKKAPHEVPVGEITREPLFLEHPAQAQHVAHQGMCQMPPTMSSDCINRKLMGGADFQHAMYTCSTPGAVSERCMGEQLSGVYQGNLTSLAMEEYIVRHGGTLRK
jgi:hypothetical protein